MASKQRITVGERDLGFPNAPGKTSSLVIFEEPIIETLNRRGCLCIMGPINHIIAFVYNIHIGK